MRNLCLDSLPPEQTIIWAAFNECDLSGFILYGGTALALRFGHRVSVDFDFFTNGPVSPEIMCDRIPWLSQNTDAVLQNSRDTFVLLVNAPGMDREAVVKLSFFGGLKLPVMSKPSRADNGIEIASVDDLLATKLKALHDRVEPKDYIDICEILRQSQTPVQTLQQGLSDFELMYFGASSAIALKELCWFKSDELSVLDRQVRETLLDVVTEVKDLPILGSRQPYRQLVKDDNDAGGFKSGC